MKILKTYCLIKIIKKQQGIQRLKMHPYLLRDHSLNTPPKHIETQVKIACSRANTNFSKINLTKCKMAKISFWQRRKYNPLQAIKMRKNLGCNINIE